MAGLLTRLKSAFLSSSRSNSTSPSASQATVQVPANISITTASTSFYRNLFGRAENIEQLALPQKLIIDVVGQAMANQAQRLKAVPRLPSVIPRLLQSLRDSKSSAKDYVNIINKDPAMTAAVLKLANSVYFNPSSKRITHIETAVVKLGVDGLRTVMSAAVMQPVIERSSPYFSNFGHKLWEHSLCCAVTCEMVARQRNLEPYKAYLLGLVHDMGKITLYSELSSQFRNNSSTTNPLSPTYASFVPLMETLSPALSHTIAKDWQLPDEICQALQQQITIAPQQHVSSYALLLFQANLACELYFSLCQASDDDRPILQRSAQKALSELSMPSNLFDTLDTLSVQV